MMDPDRAAAANDAIADVARKWFGVQSLGRDRDLSHDARHAVRITAFLRDAEGRWDRGELVIPEPVGVHLVWQPYPQGAPAVFDGPFRLSAVAREDHRGLRTAQECELSTGGAAVRLRLAPADLARLHDLLGDS
ncbi:MAG: hypothetical protein QOG49_804 [Frankiaceae bacterium]|nr:hypothetical protein [Frankiaceae bacterium]